MIDMSRWQQIARENARVRPAGAGRMAGKLALVTGAARGFGRGIAEALCASGASVAVADVDFPGAQAVAAALGERALAVEADVTDEASVARMVARAVEAFGGLDLLVANAGVSGAGGWRRWSAKRLNSSRASTTRAISSARSTPRRS